MSALIQYPLMMHLGWMLIHFLWQGVLIGLLYAGMRRLLRQATPQSRYLLALITLLVLALLPPGTFFYLSGQQMPHSATTVLLSPHTTAITAGFIPAPAPSMLTGSTVSYLPWVVLLWLAGVFLMAGRAFWGWRQTVLLQMIPSSALAHPWQPLLSALQDKMPINRSIRLLECLRVRAPMVVGWLKPVILIPPSAVCGLSWQQAEMILAHELAHIRRHDYLFNWLQVVVEALLFYHPVVHWVSRDARNEREFCCDDTVMQTCGDRVGYLKALAELEQHRLHALPALAANGGMLWNRAYRLAYRIEPLGRLPVWSAVLALCACLLATFVLLRSHPEQAKPGSTIFFVVEHVTKINAHSAADQPSASYVLHRGPTIAELSPMGLDPTAIKAQLAQPLKISSFIQPTLALAPLQALPPYIIQEAALPPAPTLDIVASHPLPQPEYPYQALRDGLGGSVHATFRIGANGRVMDIRTQVVTGPTILAHAARNALENWRFQPVRINGKSQAPQVSLAFVFSADAASKPRGTCTLVTGTHLCHWYRIEVQNIQAQTADATVGMVANLAVVENKNDRKCHPQDACFFAPAETPPGHEQEIKNQLRLLSAGMIPAF